jgi:hypothetical protein
MHPSFIKAKVFTGLALLLLTVAFTFPMIAFHGVLNKVHDGKVEEISSFSKKVWNFYNQGRYKSVTTDKEAHNNLEKMIETQAELGVCSLPIWAVSLEAPNYPKEAFPEGIPVFFHFDGYSGEVHEMNTINHYVGMDPMWVGGTIEREIGIYALLALGKIAQFTTHSYPTIGFYIIIAISLLAFFAKQKALRETGELS